jgi:hypothetical protein
MGRPSKLTDARVATICEALRKGSTRKAAYESVGISKETFSDWMGKYSAFSDAVTRAEAECENRMAQVIVDAAADDWRAAECWLKRRRREDWSEKVDHDLTTGGKPFKMYAGFDPEAV